jgi:hypothetical protein
VAILTEDEFKVLRVLNLVRKIDMSIYNPLDSVWGDLATIPITEVRDIITNRFSESQIVKQIEHKDPMGKHNIYEITTIGDKYYIEQKERKKKIELLENLQIQLGQSTIETNKKTLKTNRIVTIAIILQAIFLLIQILPLLRKALPYIRTHQFFHHLFYP